MDNSDALNLDRESILKLPRVPRSYYERSALELAPRLLGLILVHDTPRGLTAGRITETEAYQGPEDRACHAFGGRRTHRTEVMFGPPGHAYVYFTYGMHWMFNIVAAPEGIPHAVLVRSVEPMSGLDLMERRRRGKFPLTEGPARMTQAMGIDGRDNGKDLVASNLFLVFPPKPWQRPVQYAVTKRIGVDYAQEARDYPWRFVEKRSE